MVEREEALRLARLQYHVNALHVEANLDNDRRLNEALQQIYGWIASYLFWKCGEEHALPFDDFWSVVRKAVDEIYNDKDKSDHFMKKVLKEG